MIISWTIITKDIFILIDTFSLGVLIPSPFFGMFWYLLLMKIIIREDQFRRLNKSNQSLTRAIEKYMDNYISQGVRTIGKKSRNYGNLRETWCINGKESISAYYQFDDAKFRNSFLTVSQKLVNHLSEVLSIRESYVLHVISEWYEDTILPKFEEITGESGLSIDEILTQARDEDCIEESVKPEGITDEEMIDFITKNTLYTEEDLIERIEAGDEILEDLYLQIMDIVKRKESDRL